MLFRAGVCFTARKHFAPKETEGAEEQAHWQERDLMPILFCIALSLLLFPERSEGKRKSKSKLTW